LPTDSTADRYRPFSPKPQKADESNVTLVREEPNVINIQPGKQLLSNKSDNNSSTPHNSSNTNSARTSRPFCLISQTGATSLSLAHRRSITPFEEQQTDDKPMTDIDIGIDDEPNELITSTQKPEVSAKADIEQQASKSHNINSLDGLKPQSSQSLEPYNTGRVYPLSSQLVNYQTDVPLSSSPFVTSSSPTGLNTSHDTQTWRDNSVIIVPRATTDTNISTGLKSSSAPLYYSSSTTVVSNQPTSSLVNNKARPASVGPLSSQFLDTCATSVAVTPSSSYPMETGDRNISIVYNPNNDSANMFSKSNGIDPLHKPISSNSWADKFPSENLSANLVKQSSENGFMNKNLYMEELLGIIFDNSVLDHINESDKYQLENSDKSVVDNNELPPVTSQNCQENTKISITHYFSQDLRSNSLNDTNSTTLSPFCSMKLSSEQGFTSDLPAQNELLHQVISPIDLNSRYISPAVESPQSQEYLPTDSSCEKQTNPKTELHSSQASIEKIVDGKDGNDVQTFISDASLHHQQEVHSLNHPWSPKGVSTDSGSEPMNHKISGYRPFSAPNNIGTGDMPGSVIVLKDCQLSKESLPKGFVSLNMPLSSSMKPNTSILGYRRVTPIFVRQIDDSLLGKIPTCDTDKETADKQVKSTFSISCRDGQRDEPPSKGQPGATLPQQDSQGNNFSKKGDEQIMSSIPVSYNYATRNFSEQGAISRQNIWSPSATKTTSSFMHSAVTTHSSSARPSLAPAPVTASLIQSSAGPSTHALLSIPPPETATPGTSTDAFITPSSAGSKDMCRNAIKPLHAL